ncbi:MAG: ATP-binding cassette domain-containing protein, partial [Pseudomonadota bacterium]
MSAPLLTLKDIHVSFGSKPLLAGTDVSVHPGERCCLVGRNGSGKSTLLKVAAGLVEPDEGERFVQPGTVLRYLPQEVDFSGVSNLREFVVADLEDPTASHLADKWLAEVGLSPDHPTHNLSGGEARRAAIARALAADPDILLFDEPTNHLDLPAI